MNIQDNRTICAISTAAGSGGIAVIRVSGVDAFTVVDRLFKSKKAGLTVEKMEANTVVFGEIIDQDKVVDEVLVTVFRGPHSYTGEHTVEISCHGSIYIQQSILNLLVKSGAELATAGEFTQRAFLNGKMDLAQAEGVADLIASESEAMHRLSMQQLKGGYSQELENLRQEVLSFAALLELELDFSEEDVEFADRTQFTNLINKIHEVITGMINSFSYGNAIKNGFSVAIVGRPNVGKSTLLNRLLREEKAIVSDIPGTTRDVIEDTINLEGINFRFIDTAGLRDTEDTIENIGIGLAYKKVEQAQIVLFLVDVTQPLESIKEEFFKVKDSIAEHQQMCVILNKIDASDKVSEEALKSIVEKEQSIISISAKQGLNLKDLEQFLVIVAQEQSQTNSNIVVSNVRHLEALQKAEQAILRSKEGIGNGMPTDLLAMDVREAVHFIGEITGQISNDEVLGYIFGNFCIGK
jgi:tRNA modification GTPase